MCLRVRILCLLPKPQHSSFPTFFHFDEAVFASSDLKCLKYFHASSIPLADAHHPFLPGHCTDVRSPCLRRIAPTKRLPLVILQQARPGAGLGAEVFLTTGEARKAIHRKEWLVFRFCKVSRKQRETEKASAFRCR